MKVLQILIAGLIIFAGWMVASLVSGFVTGLLLSILPISGLVASAVTILVFCLILGFVVTWLLAKFH